MTDRYTLPGSDRREFAPHGVVPPGCHPDERVSVTIRLTTDDDLAIRAVSSWAISQRLSPTLASPAQKLVQATGSIANLEQAFGVKLHRREIRGGGTHRAHFGPVSIPSQFEPLISGVFGLDDRPCATPRIKRLDRSVGELVATLAQRRIADLIYDYTDSEYHEAAVKSHMANWFGRPYQKPPGTFTPLEVAAAYQFPPGTGKGETIALIELGGGYRPADLRAYWTYLGITGPTVEAIGVNGGRNQPGSDADGEVLLDIQVAGSIAPEATIAVYFTGNTEQDFLDALSAAVHDGKVSVISISWGGPEDSFTDAAKTAFNAILKDAADLGITVMVAAGDNGSSDGEQDGKSHVDFPASSPFSLSCGGTKLVATGSTVESEVVWNETTIGEGATGGGCSAFFPLPWYQAKGVCGDWNSVPDIAGNADPSSGYTVRIDGKFETVAGTSAVAPLIAGLVARLNQIRGRRTGFLNQILYQNPSVCRDVTVGNNGAFTATVGPDPVSGLGSINGTRLLAVLPGATA